MLKVAIVGCGKIADSHAAQILRIKGCEIVGACDQEPLMARQLAERFPIRRYFGDLEELLSEARPDVVHITTPPQSHFDIAKTCMERDCHVYGEAVHAGVASGLLACANEKGLKITVGHDDQFSHVARRMRRLIQSGFSGPADPYGELLLLPTWGDGLCARAFGRQTTLGSQLAGETTAQHHQPWYRKNRGVPEGRFARRDRIWIHEPSVKGMGETRDHR